MILEGRDSYTSPSFSLRQRLTRQLWDITWLLLFRPTPRVMHAWRRTLLRAFGARLGEHVHIHPSVKVWAPWNLTIDSFVGIGEGAVIYSMDKIHIESYAVISQGTYLCAGSHDFNSVNMQLTTSPITIKRHAWLCAQSFVCPGVVIAEGSVIAARGVVSKSLTDVWAVWAGVPVKRVGNRSQEKAKR
ncbi:MAG: putative colanic acid biosynthesis acetyltransferase [Pseudomonadota bacterium]